MVDKYISDSELKKFGSVENSSEKAKSLLKHQQSNWNLVQNNFNALNNVKTKEFIIDSNKIKIQFNPSRIISSSAKVDKKSIENRKCFLCAESLPKEQKGINLYDKYTILCNPYPIFKEHLTIPHNLHIPQNINDAFEDLLKISYELRHNYFVFYNGPKCGASAPDHLHFQAGLKNSTPLEEYYSALIEMGKRIYSNESTKIVFVTQNTFRFVSIKSNNKDEISKRFFSLLQSLKEFNKNDEEPLLNLFCFYKDNNWNLFVIPRKQHRPKQYFLAGDDKLLISPASVDMAGLLITPREEDFNKISKEDITNIYKQVLFDEYDFMKLNI